MPSSPLHKTSMQEVLLADRNALVTKNIVRSRDMEEEVGNAKLNHVVLPVVGDIVGTKLECDINGLLALVSLLVNSVEEVDGLLDALVELLEGGLSVGHADGLDAGDSNSSQLGGVAAALDLESKIAHVFVEAGFDESSRVDIVGLGVLLALLEDGGEIGQGADEESDVKGVERDHFCGFRWKIWVDSGLFEEHFRN